MSKNVEDTSKDINSGNDGFIWSGRFAVIAGFVLALALAAARAAAALAANGQWQP